MKNSLIEKAIAHNESIDTYINVTLRNHFGGDKINLSQWFEAQQLIRAQNFYDKGMEILRELKAAGIDCKMDMQSNKLHCAAYNVRAY